jgi:hypothetical protein
MRPSAGAHAKEHRAAVTTPQFSRLASATAQAQAHAFELSTAGQTQGTFPCPRCGSTVRFTAPIPHKSSGQCSAGGCIRWAA